MLRKAFRRLSRRGHSGVWSTWPLAFLRGKDPKPRQSCVTFAPCFSPLRGPGGRGLSRAGHSMSGITSSTAFTAAPGRATCRSPSPIHTLDVKGNKRLRSGPNRTVCSVSQFTTKRMTRNSPNLAHRFMTTARPSSLCTALLLVPVEGLEPPTP